MVESAGGFTPPAFRNLGDAIDRTVPGPWQIKSPMRLGLIGRAKMTIAASSITSL
jgi:hypothetical protein